MGIHLFFDDTTCDHIRQAGEHCVDVCVDGRVLAQEDDSLNLPVGNTAETKNVSVVVVRH